MAIRRPFRAERDPVTGCVLLFDQRAKNPQLLEMLTAADAAALMIDLQQCHNAHVLANIEATDRRFMRLCGSAELPTTIKQPLTLAEQAAEALGRG